MVWAPSNVGGSRRGATVTSRRPSRQAASADLGQASPLPAAGFDQTFRDARLPENARHSPAVQFTSPLFSCESAFTSQFRPPQVPPTEEDGDERATRRADAKLTRSPLFRLVACGPVEVRHRDA
jgi:hypothetical protein